MGHSLRCQQRGPDAHAVSDPLHYPQGNFHRNVVSAARYRVGCLRCTITIVRICISKKACCRSCKLVQVAVVVDDHKLNEWVQLAAECLTSAAAPERDTTPTEQPSASSALSSCTAAQSLASLQDHSRSMILSAACAPDRSCMLNLLQWLPQSLHTAVLDAAIKSPHRSLKASFEEHHQPLLFLDALATLPADPPAIASLRIDFTNWTATVSTVDRASHIVTALRHHSALSTLKLSMNATADEVQRLAPGISSLSSLHDLRLGDSYNLFPADAIHDIQSILHSLPQLNYLSLSLDSISRFPTLKRQRDADTADGPPPAQRTLATLLSSAPALTSLYLRLQPDHRSVEALEPDVPEAMFPVGSSVSLPHLCHAALMVDYCAIAARLLRSLDASPLTSLEVMHMQSASLQAEDDATRTAFARSLCAFPQLRSMHFTASPGNWAARSFHTLLHFPPSALTALQELSELQLHVDFETMHMAAPQLAAAMPALQQLTLICTCSRHRTIESSPERWGQVLGPLNRLQLGVDLSVEAWASDSGPGPSALASMTCFSALQLRSYNMVRVAADVEALARMTQLRSLSLDDFTLPAEFHARLMLALPPLQRLTELLVVGEGVHVAYEAKQLQGVWPELERLGVSLDASRPSVELRAVFQAMCGLPALQQLELFARCGCASGEVGRRGGDGEDITDVPGSLWDVAAAAGVKVEFFGDFTFMDS